LYNELYYRHINCDLKNECGFVFQKWLTINEGNEIKQVTRFFMNGFLVLNTP